MLTDNVALARAALRKASFASRSEAGRYAAQQRWKNNVKEDAVPSEAATGLNETVKSDETRQLKDGSTLRQATVNIVDIKGKTITAYIKSQGQTGGQDVSVELYAGEYPFNGKMIGKLDAHTDDGSMGRKGKLAIMQVDVTTKHQRKGYATAMMRVASKYNIGSEPLVHSTVLTSAGAAFAAANPEISKASFASRSEAGRYAANMRWQGQGKVFDGSTDATNFALLDKDQDRFKLDRTVHKAVKDRIAREISPEDQADLFLFLDRKPFSGSREKMIEEIRDGVYSDNLLYTIEHGWTGHDDSHGHPQSVTSIALQEAVRRRFNPPNAKPTLEKANSIWLEKVNNPTLTKVSDIIVDEVYKDTQRYLAEKGVKSVVLYRGTKNDELAAVAGSKNVTVRLRPFAAFSSERRIADMFAQKNDWLGRKAKGVILKATVDAKNIFSIGRVNFGMAPENELLVLGGDITVDVIKYKPSKRFPD